MAKSNKFEKKQLQQINEAGIFTPIINAIIKRKVNRKARELQKDPKLSASYKNMEDAIHGFMRSMEVFLDSSARSVKSYDEDSDLNKDMEKRMKAFGPEVYKSWKKLKKKHR